jgi:hypothetical protein
MTFQMNINIYLSYNTAGHPRRFVHRNESLKFYTSNRYINYNTSVRVCIVQITSTLASGRALNKHTDEYHIPKFQTSNYLYFLISQ